MTDVLQTCGQKNMQTQSDSLSPSVFRDTDAFNKTKRSQQKYQSDSILLSYRHSDPSREISDHNRVSSSLI